MEGESEPRASAAKRLIAGREADGGSPRPGTALPDREEIYREYAQPVSRLCRIKLVGAEAFLSEAAENRRLYYKGKFAIGAGPQ